MRTRIYLCLLAALLVLVCGAAAAQPRALPQPPEDTRLLAAYPSLRDAREVGAGVVITGVDLFSCAEGALQINYAVFIFDPSQTYVLNIVARTNGLTVMNRRLLWVVPSGHYTVTVEYSNSGGPAFDFYPLTAGIPIVVEMVFSEESGKPLWFSSMTVADCDGSPNSTSGFAAKPVKMLNKNPTFKPNLAQPTVASKWTPTGKVTYGCASSGICMQKLKGKAGKPAVLSQTLKIKPDALPVGSRFGLAISFDGSALISGTAYVTVTLTRSGTSDLQMHSTVLFDDGPIFVTGDVVVVPHPSASLVPLDRVLVEIRFQDAFGGNDAEGLLKVTDIYAFAVTP